MISLSRHIELLLLEHDCVIVPGLGGFIANHTEAQYDGDGDRLFLPPYRTVRFNQQLQMNDGLLVQSYMAAYDASYPAAFLQMEKDIEKVVYELDVNGEYTLDKIGVLRKEINQSVDFTPAEMSVLTPSFYGLCSYEFQSLSSAVKAKEVADALNTAVAMAVNANRDSKIKREDCKGRGKETSARLHSRWVDVGISVAAAILLLFCVSYQTFKNTASDTDTVMAAFYTTNDVKDACPAVKKTNKSVRAKVGAAAKKTPAEEVAEKVADETPVVLLEKQKQKYAIVLASYVSKENADRFIDNLAKQGFKEGRYVKNGKISRILYSNYRDREEAQQELLELRRQCREFADGWILEL